MVAAGGGGLGFFFLFATVIGGNAPFFIAAQLVGAASGALLATFPVRRGIARFEDVPTVEREGRAVVVLPVDRETSNAHGT